MSILAFFAAETVDAVITRPTYTKTNGVMTAGTPIAVGAVKALYWKGSMAQAFVSERFKERTAGALSVDPDTDIKAGDKIAVQGTDYKVIDTDSFAGSDEHIQVAMELYS